MSSLYQLAIILKITGNIYLASALSICLSFVVLFYFVLEVLLYLGQMLRDFSIPTLTSHLFLIKPLKLIMLFK